MLNLTYFSHSCFYLHDGTNKVVIDPYLSDNPNAPVNPDQVDVDFIALTHGHGDHIGDAIWMAKNNEATIIAVNELANYCAAQDCMTHNMHIGGGFNFPFGRLKFTIAHHGSSTNDWKYLGQPAGIVIKMGGQTVYHCGDTGLFLDMKLIGELDKIDIMLVPIGDNFTMGIDDAVKAVEFVQPGLAVPMHYNTFPVIQANPLEFVEKCQSKGMNARAMKYGETMSF
jgi:L-ascorbate metabolism protein UlaG (beta-lactamase superfamily)